MSRERQIANNQFLTILPESDSQELLRHAERVTLPLREAVCEPGRPVEYAWLPLTSVLSSLVILADGTPVETFAIGREGVAGLALLVEPSLSSHRVVQEVEGETFRIPASAFRGAMARSEPLRQLLQRYALTLLDQAGQNAACLARHPVEERMCRWLLASSERAKRDEFPITQEFLSEMLGVRRQAVNINARLLQRAGIIRYTRGRLTILDRSALEQGACECYEINQATYNRMMQLPGRPPKFDIHGKR